MFLYSVPAGWWHVIRPAWDGLLSIMENGIILTILIGGTAVLMVYWLPAMAVCGLLCLVGVHRSRAFSGLKLHAKTAAYVASAIVIVTLLYGLRAAAAAYVVPRAYIFVEGLRVENDQGHLTVHIHAKTGGEVILPSAMMNADIVAHDYTLEKTDIEQMFAQADWSGPGWVSGFENNLTPGEEFWFSKPFDPPNDFRDYMRVLSGTMHLYVLTRARFRDRWGVIGWKHSCWRVSAGDGFAPHKCMFGNDLLTITRIVLSL